MTRPTALSGTLGHGNGRLDAGDAVQPRSWLVTPGSDARKLERAAAAGADAVVIDLEDAVASDRKAEARCLVRDALRDLDFGGKRVALRINGAATPDCWRDLSAVVPAAGAQLDAVVLAKAESSADVHFVDRLLSALEAEAGIAVGSIGIELLIESATGAVALRELTTSSSRLRSLVFGPGDYAFDLDVLRLEIGTIDPRYPGHQWHWPMSELAVHARAAGLAAIDGPTTDFRDAAAFHESAARARLLGFGGKWCIHPNQVAWANEAFSIAPDEVTRAREVLEACASAREHGAGATAVGAVMVDEATRAIAERIVARSRAERGEHAAHAQHVEHWQRTARTSKPGIEEGT